MKRTDERHDAFWTRKLSALLLLVVVLVSSLGFILDRLLIKEGLPRIDLLIITNTITGLVAGGLFYQFARNEKAHRDIVRERMRTIAELNHHIRNALQVIKFCGGGQSSLDSMQLELIKESASRIEWALQEVLPKYPWAPSNKSLESGLANAARQHVPGNWDDTRLQQRKHANPH
jgi:hypothetical protein